MTRITLNGNGTETNETSEIEGYEYTITLRRYRSVTALPYTVLTDVVASPDVEKSITVTRVSEHSAPLAGTFSLNIAGRSLEFNGQTTLLIDIEPYQLASALNNFYGTKEINVARVQGTYATESVEFIIEYVGLIEEPGAITINTDTVTGGLTTIFSERTVLRQYSNRPLYSPVPL